MSRTGRTFAAALAVLTGAGTLAASRPAAAIEPAIGRADVFVALVHGAGQTTPTIVQTTSDRAATASVSRSARGSYTVSLRNVTGSKGNAQLFQYHRAGTTPDAICSIASVTPSSTRTQIRVKCFDATTGRTTDAADFAISYAGRNRTDTFGTAPGFFTLTSTSATADHRPTTQFRSDPTGLKAKVTKLVTGVYQVRIPTGSETYPSSEGVAFTTAVSTSVPRYCNPSYWEPDETLGSDGNKSMNVTVRCYDRFGQPANSRFSLVLTTGNQFGFQLPGAAQYVWAPWSDTPTGTTAYGDNLESTYNTFVRVATSEGTGSQVTFPHLLDGHPTDLDAVAVSAYGGNHRCVLHAITFGGVNVDDASVQVVCRDINGAVTEAAFSAGYVV